MNPSRPALVALLVGLALLVSPAALLQFQEPAECANDVEPADTEQAGDIESTFRYDELSPDAKRAFDRARSADGSVIVSGERCPEAFSYTAERHRYEIVTADSRYVLTTYANDLVPEVPIVAGLLSVLGLSLLGIGIATPDESETRLPLWLGAVGLVTLAAVAAATVLNRSLWAAIGWTGLVTAGTLVGAGVALPRRRALLLGGALAVLPSVVLVPLAGVSLWFLVPAVLPLALVGAGIGVRTVSDAVRA